MPQHDQNGNSTFTRTEWLKLAALISAITIAVIGGGYALAVWQGGTSYHLEAIEDQLVSINAKLDLEASRTLAVRDRCEDATAALREEHRRDIVNLQAQILQLLRRDPPSR